MEICGHSLLLTYGGQRPKLAPHSQSIVQPADLACLSFFLQSVLAIAANAATSFVTTISR